jgi:hypothetical protein
MPLERRTTGRVVHPQLDQVVPPTALRVATARLLMELKRLWWMIAMRRKLRMVMKGMTRERKLMKTMTPS